MKGQGILLGILVEEGLAELTGAPSCVVLTCITHTSTRVARGKIHDHVKVTTAGMPMTLTFWSRTREVDMEWADPWQVWLDRIGHGTYPSRHRGAQALLPAMGGPGAGPGSALSGYQLCGGGRCKGHAPDREENHMSLPQSPSLPSQPVTGCPSCGNHHAFHIGWGPRYRPAFRGMAITQAADSGHKLIESIVIEGVSLEHSQGPITQGVHFGEVCMEVSHMQKLLRHRDLLGTLVIIPLWVGQRERNW